MHSIVISFVEIFVGIFSFNIPCRLKLTPPEPIHSRNYLSAFKEVGEDICKIVDILSSG